MARTGKPATRHVAAVERAAALLAALEERRAGHERARPPHRPPPQLGLPPARDPRRTPASSSTSPRPGRYRLGLRLIELGNAVLARLDLREIARPHLRALVDETGRDGDALGSRRPGRDHRRLRPQRAPRCRASRASGDRASRTPPPPARWRSPSATSSCRRARLTALHRADDRRPRRAGARGRARPRAGLGKGGGRAGGEPQRRRRPGARQPRRARGRPRPPGPRAAVRRGRRCRSALEPLLAHAAAVSDALGWRPTAKEGS